MSQVKIIVVKKFATSFLPGGYRVSRYSTLGFSVVRQCRRANKSSQRVQSAPLAGTLTIGLDRTSSGIKIDRVDLQQAGFGAFGSPPTHLPLRLRLVGRMKVTPDF